MAKWRYTLDIKDEYKEASAGTLTPHEMAQRIAAKIRALPVMGTVIDRLASNFEGIPEDGTFDDTDDAMEQLYNWGDQHDGPRQGLWNDKTCWIATS